MSRRRKELGSSPAEPPESSGAGLARRFWESLVLKGPVIPRSDRDRALVTVHTLLLHLRPVRVPARTLRFTHTFGLGGSSLVLIVLLAGSGLLLMLGYQPFPGAAYDSVVSLETEVTFGSLVRGVHYWSANLLVVVVVLHMARVFFTGGYHGPRQFNWVVGGALLAGVLANAFTGYLLPWDQLAYWAVTISTGMLGYVPLVGESLQRIARGGSDVSAETLVLFYTLHTSIMPVTLLGLMAFHFWRVRKAGGVVVPPASGDETDGSDEKVLFVPHLLVREVAMALAIAAAVTVLGAALGAPLGAPANPGMSPDPTKAPWYFQGFQELLVHVHPLVAVVLLPLAAAAGFVVLPYVTEDSGPAGRWFLTARARRVTAGTALLALVATPLAVVVRESLGSAPGAIGGGVLPVVALAVGLVALYRALRGRFGLSVNEAVQGVVAFVATVFGALTVIGVFFRGAGMALRWPWGA